VYCTVRRRLRARAARDGAMRMAVEMAMFTYRVLRCAGAGKLCGAACYVWDAIKNNCQRMLLIQRQRLYSQPSSLLQEIPRDSEECMRDNTGHLTFVVRHGPMQGRGSLTGTSSQSGIPDCGEVANSTTSSLETP
jgi:hypothetical protein